MSICWRGQTKPNRLFDVRRTEIIEIRKVALSIVGHLSAIDTRYRMNIRCSTPTFHLSIFQVSDSHTFSSQCSRRDSLWNSSWTSSTWQLTNFVLTLILTKNCSYHLVRPSELHRTRFTRLAIFVGDSTKFVFKKDFVTNSFLNTVFLWTDSV